MNRANAAAFVLALLTTAVPCGAGRAQPPTPSTNDLPSFFTIGTGASPAFGQDGGFTDAAGTAGTNPGWSLFRYGTANSSSGRLRVTAVSTSPATLTYWTATPAEPNLSAAAMHFDTSTAAGWTVVTAKTGASAPLQITVDDNSPTTFLALTDPSQLGAYNARLNQVLKFDASEWYDPATNAPISAAAGTFSFGFTDFNATLGYRSIQLQFAPATPVPEPTGLLALATLAIGAVGAIRRLNRARAG
jgi:hypothetical protein